MVKETNTPAPGNLEKVRLLLNTWRIPNTTRMATDDLLTKQDVEQFYINHFFNELGKGTQLGDFADVIALRNDLRKCLKSAKSNELINHWLNKYPISVKIIKGNDNIDSKVSYEPKEVLCSAILAIVIGSISNGEWERLKECPDCKWVFFDHSRNKSKVWCGMYALSDEGRACGSISKVNKWREKQKKSNNKD